MNESAGISRRDVLRLGAVAGGVVATAGITPLLAACTTQASTNVNKQASSVHPDYVPLATVPAWLPATAQGVEAGYNNFPANPPDSVKRAPMSGGTANGFCILYLPPPAPMSGNAAWQAVNKRLGGQLNVNYVSAADYLTKATTLMASDTLPDLLQVATFTNIPNVSPFLQAKCVDLTSELAGAAIRDYPNLANIPTFSWKSCVYNGGIYGVPVPRPLMVNPLYVHQERFDELGVTQMKNADDLLRVFKELTRPSENQWAFCANKNSAFRYDVARMVHHVPNIWKVDGSGHFTRDLETPESKEAVSFWRRAVAAGVVLPGSEGFTTNQMKDAFKSGKAASCLDGWGNTFADYWDSMKAINPAFKLRLMVLPGASGGKQTFWYSSGIFSFTSIPQSSKSRVKELLGVLNFLASPFGTSENLLLNYGVDGVDFHRDSSGNPAATPRGTAEMTVPWKYLAASPGVQYDAPSPDATRYAYEGSKALIPLGISNPAVGLYSNTDSTRGPIILQTFTDGVSDIIAGRRPVSDYDGLVSAWRSSGGDQIRTEYQKAYDASHKKGA
jgi:putative aldouronate transport system substrate-binding protein